MNEIIYYFFILIFSFILVFGIILFISVIFAIFYNRKFAKLNKKYESGKKEKRLNELAGEIGIQSMKRGN